MLELKEEKKEQGNCVYMVNLNKYEPYKTIATVSKEFSKYIELKQMIIQIWRF